MLDKLRTQARLEGRPQAFELIRGYASNYAVGVPLQFREVSVQDNR